MKENKDNINRWRDIPFSCIGRINIVKMTKLPNAIYRFSVNPIKSPMAFSTELEQKNLTIRMETQKDPKQPKQSFFFFNFTILYWFCHTST